MNNQKLTAKEKRTSAVQAVIDRAIPTWDTLVILRKRSDILQDINDLKKLSKSAKWVAAVEHWVCEVYLADDKDLRWAVLEYSTRCFGR